MASYYGGICQTTAIKGLDIFVSICFLWCCVSRHVSTWNWSFIWPVFFFFYKPASRVVFCSSLFFSCRANSHRKKKKINMCLLFSSQRPDLRRVRLTSGSRDDEPPAKRRPPGGVFARWVTGYNQSVIGLTYLCSLFSWWQSFCRPFWVVILGDFWDVIIIKTLCN